YPAIVAVQLVEFLLYCRGHVSSFLYILDAGAQAYLFTSQPLGFADRLAGGVRGLLVRDSALQRSDLTLQANDSRVRVVVADAHRLQLLPEGGKPGLPGEARHDIGATVSRSALVEQLELVLAVEAQLGVQSLQGRQVHAFLLR